MVELVKKLFTKKKKLNLFNLIICIYILLLSTLGLRFVVRWGLCMLENSVLLFVLLDGKFGVWTMEAPYFLS